MLAVLATTTGSQYLSPPWRGMEDAACVIDLRQVCS